jgi:hypothetical protein
MSAWTPHYDEDFYAWILEQAQLLKARQFEALDLDNLVDEVESLARQERHLVQHRLAQLLTHLVAWWGNIPERCRRWQSTIAVQRYELQDILHDSPSLAAVVPEELAEAWAWVRQRSAETWPYAAFPQDCPWTPSQLLDDDFWPAHDTFAVRAREKHDAPRPAMDPDR